MANTLTLSSRSGRLTLVVCILASGTGFLMGSAVTIALPTIQATLDTSLSGVQWVVNAYSLMLGSLILVSGALGDIYGVRRVFNSGLLIFAGASLLAGAAPSLTLLVVIRGIQGIGAALMVPGSLAIISNAFAQEERGRVIGLWAGISGAIAALGPFIGGFLAEITWRLVFVAMAPFGLAAFVFSRAVIPRISSETRRTLDVPGAIMILLALLGLATTLIRLPKAAWDALNVAGLAGGVALLALFALWNARRPSPLVPPAMFTRQVTGANAATLLIYFTFSAVLFLLSYLFQQYLGMRAPVAGLAVLPVTLIIALLSGASGRITDRFGPRGQMIAGPAVIAAASAWFLWRAGSTQYLAHYLPGIILQGIGIVLIIPSITTSALNVPPRFSGTASGVNNALARIADLLAVAAAGSALAFGFATTLEAGIAELELSRQERAAVMAESDKLLNLEIPDSIGNEQEAQVAAAARSAFVAGVRAAFTITLLIALATILVAALTIPRRPPTLSIDDDVT
ncbi:MAG: MFS transporter [Spirochaetaceae bacterium]